MKLIFSCQISFYDLKDMTNLNLMILFDPDPKMRFRLFRIIFIWLFRSGLWIIKSKIMDYKILTKMIIGVYTNKENEIRIN